MDRALGLITTNYTCEGACELIKSRPPAALPLAGRYRCVDFILSNMVNAGMHTVGIILPFNYRSLVDHLGSGKEWSLDRKHDGMFMLPGSPFGTARSGPRFLLRDLLDNRVFIDKDDREYVLLSSANFVYSVDLTELVDAHIENDADITVFTSEAARSLPQVTSFEFTGDRVSAIQNGAQAGDIVSLDCFVINRSYLQYLLDLYKEAGYLDLFEAISDDLDQIKIKEHRFSGGAMAVFSARDLYDKTMDFLHPEIFDKYFDPAYPIYTKAHDNAPSQYEQSAEVRNSMIAGGTRIAGKVENSVLGRGVVVERGATVRNSIILQSCCISEGATVEFAILDRNNKIPAGHEIKGTAEDIFVKGKEEM